MALTPASKKQTNLNIIITIKLNKPSFQHHKSNIMAPQRQAIAKAGSRRGAPKGYAAGVYETLTSPDNASVLKSVAIFGVSLAL